MLLVLPEPMLEQIDGRKEVPAQRDQEGDVVEVLAAAETVSQIVAEIHKQKHGNNSVRKKTIIHKCVSRA